MKFRQRIQFMLVSCVIVLSIGQNAFGMDEEEEMSSWFFQIVPKTDALFSQSTDLVDQPHSVTSLKKQDSQIQTPFFPETPDEITLRIFSFLFQGGRALKHLACVARTCQKGYALTQHPKVWEGLKETYVSHLPEEYVNRLIKGKKEQGLPLARTLVQQLCTHQSEEIKQLKYLLSEARTNNRFILLDDNFKLSLFNLIRKDNLQGILRPAELYIHQEEKLTYINTCLINAYLTLIQRGPPTHFNKACILEWGGSLTRLPREAMALMQGFFADYHNPEIIFYLGGNQLRWIPSEFFSIKKIRYLDLQNNQLSYLPVEMEQVQDDLKTLCLGNYEPRLKGGGLLYDGSTRRTIGNRFTTLPSVVFTLSNLQNLLIQRVDLEKLPDDGLYEAFPHLSFINISHNKLKVLPQSTFKDRQITVNSLDNPVKLTFNAATRQHYKDTLRYYRDTCIDNFCQYGVLPPLNFIFSSVATFDLYMQGVSNDPGFSDKNFISMQKDF